MGQQYDIARCAFEKALKHFENCKGGLQSGAQYMGIDYDMNSVLQFIKESQQKYEGQKQSKARKWLSRLSSRIVLYGSILDVFVQHHPEYVSLAWGAFKLIFVGIVNHEHLTKELAKALCRIADVLPRAEKELLSLYPTETLRTLVAELYAKIVEFAIRAILWYKEGKLRHVVSAIVRPYSLLFEDIADDIAQLSNRIDNLAMAFGMIELLQARVEIQELRRAQAETRDEVRRAQQETRAISLELRTALEGMSSTAYSTLDSLIQTRGFQSPDKCLEYFKVRRNRRRAKHESCNDFFRCALALQAWARTECSSQLVVSGTFETRHAARDFAADVIDLIQVASIPVVWALNPGQISTEAFSTADLLEYLVSRVLQQNHTLLDEQSAALNAARFQSAKIARDWLNLLESPLEGLSQMYMILDAKILIQCLAGETTTWVKRFQDLFAALQARQRRTAVKVAFVSCRSNHKTGLGDFDERENLRIPSKRTGGVRKPTQNTSSSSRRSR